MSVSQFAKHLLGAAGGAVILALALGSPNASASLISTNPMVCQPGSTATDCIIGIDKGNAGLNPTYSGPYVSGDITLIAPNEVQVSLTGLSQVIAGVTYQYEFGELFFNLNDPNATISNITSDPVSHPYSAACGSPAPDVYGISGTNTCLDPTKPGRPGAHDSISFDVTWTSAELLSDGLPLGFSDLLTDPGVLALDPERHSAGAHIFVVSSQGDLVAQGFAAWPDACDRNANRCAVPEPGSLALLSSALLGLGVLRRRRKS